MREWKQLFVNGQLFEKKKTIKNQLILTLADDYKTAQHVQNVLTNLKYLYNKSTPFNKAFAHPYAHGNAIYLTLNSHQRKVRIDKAFDTIVEIVQESISKKNILFEAEQLESESEQPQIVQSVVKKRDRQSLQLSVNAAFEKGQLFQSVKISKMGATFEIAEKFNSKEYYRFISQRLNAQHRTSQALAHVCLPIKDLRRKPSLRLKANHHLTAEKLLNLFKAPIDAEKEALATVPEQSTQKVTQASEVVAIPVIETPTTTMTPLLEETDDGASSPEITPNNTPEITPDVTSDNDDSAFDGLDEMLAQLNSNTYRASSYFDLNTLFRSEDYALWDPDNNVLNKGLFYQYGNISGTDLFEDEYEPSSSEQLQQDTFSSMLKTRTI